MIQLRVSNFICGKLVSCSVGNEAELQLKTRFSGALPDWIQCIQ